MQVLWLPGSWVWGFAITICTHSWFLCIPTDVLLDRSLAVPTFRLYVNMVLCKRQPNYVLCSKWFWCCSSWRVPSLHHCTGMDGCPHCTNEWVSKMLVLTVCQLHWSDWVESGSTLSFNDCSPVIASGSTSKVDTVCLASWARIWQTHHWRFWT